MSLTTYNRYNGEKLPSIYLYVGCMGDVSMTKHWYNTVNFLKHSFFMIIVSLLRVLSFLVYVGYTLFRSVLRRKVKFSSFWTQETVLDVSFRLLLRVGIFFGRLKMETKWWETSKHTCWNANDIYRLYVSSIQKRFCAMGPKPASQKKQDVHWRSWQQESRRRYPLITRPFSLKTHIWTSIALYMKWISNGCWMSTCNVHIATRSCWHALF